MKNQIKGFVNKQTKMAMLKTLMKTPLVEYLKNAPISMRQYYINNGAPPMIGDLVDLSNKRFGVVMENLVANLVGAKKIPDKKNTTGWDIELRDKKIELKASRYWRTMKTWKWQHVMPDHEWEILLLAAVDFTCIRLFCITKDKFNTLVAADVIKQQGNAGGQGFWFSYNQIKDHVYELTPYNEENTIENIQARTLEWINQMEE